MELQTSLKWGSIESALKEVLPTSKQTRSLEMKSTVSGGQPPETVVWQSDQSGPPHLAAHIVNRLPVGAPVSDQSGGTAQLHDKPVGLHSRTDRMVVICLFIEVQNPALDGLVLMSPYTVRRRHTKILWPPNVKRTSTDRKSQWKQEAFLW